MLRLLTLDKHGFTIFKWQMMPQSGRKLTYRFLTDFTGPAIRWHTLNPQLWIHQLRGAGALTDTPFHPHHTPASNITRFFTWGIRHKSPLPQGKKKIFKHQEQKLSPPNLHRSTGSCFWYCSEERWLLALGSLWFP